MAEMVREMIVDGPSDGGIPAARRLPLAPARPVPQDGLPTR